MLRVLGFVCLGAALLIVSPACEVDCDVCCHEVGDTMMDCITIEDVDKSACEDCSIGDDVEANWAKWGVQLACECEGD